MTDDVGPVFAALADPTRRQMVQMLLREGSASVPSLTGQFPITRQAIAKHMAALDQAGLIERAPDGGREVHYRLRHGALRPAATWLREADEAWEQRLERLRDTVERRAKG